MNGVAFSSLEIDTIGEIMNISMGSAATAASTLLNSKVNITTPRVAIASMSDFEIKMLEPAIAVEIQYVEGLEGPNILLLRQKDAKSILSQMLQTELDESYELDEMAQSAICELMNQMMGSSATVLSTFLGRSINISTPTTIPVGEWEDFKQAHMPSKEQILTITFTLDIENLVQSEFVSVMDMDLAKEIIEISLNFGSDTAEEPAPAQEPAPAPVAVASPPTAPAAVPQAAIPEAPQAPPPQAMPQQPPAGPPPNHSPAPYYQQPAYPSPAGAGYPPGYGYPPGPPPGYYPPYPSADPIMVKGYDYSDFGSGDSIKEQPHNIDLVMNVPVTVTVELGRTRRKIKEILEFGQGTIVELDKQAGSQVDVIVNGQLIAKGDVVVVDDNFSIRITEILKARDSLALT